MNGAQGRIDGAGARAWDALVIGGGPGGTVAARELARGGASVLLVEKRQFPRPKVCGACLNGKALGVLQCVGLGDLVDRIGGINLDRFEIRLRGHAASYSLPAGKAIGRDVFDQALVEAAIGSGVEFVSEASAMVEPGTGTTRKVSLERKGQTVTVEARVVVVAAGLAGSATAAEPGLRTSVAPASRMGVGCEVSRFPSAYEPGTIHMALGRSGYVGLVRLGNGNLNVAAAFDKDFLRSSKGAGAAALSVLKEAKAPAVPSMMDADWLGTVALTRQTRPVASHRLFLIGDAAGYVEPFTGEGMGAALVGARAVVPLALRGVAGWQDGLSREWGREYERLVGRPQFICRGLAAAARNATVARAVFALAHWTPALSGAVIRKMNANPPALDAV